jgi:hypothetical protein
MPAVRRLEAARLRRRCLGWTAVVACGLAAGDASGASPPAPGSQPVVAQVPCDDDTMFSQDAVDCLDWQLDPQRHASSCERLVVALTDRGLGRACAARPDAVTSNDVAAFAEASLDALHTWAMAPRDGLLTAVDETRLSEAERGRLPRYLDAAMAFATPGKLLGEGSTPGVCRHVATHFESLTRGAPPLRNPIRVYDPGPDPMGSERPRVDQFLMQCACAADFYVADTDACEDLRDDVLRSGDGKKNLSSAACTRTLGRLALAVAACGAAPVLPPPGVETRYSERAGREVALEVARWTTESRADLWERATVVAALRLEALPDLEEMARDDVSGEWLRMLRERVASWVGERAPGGSEVSTDGVASPQDRTLAWYPNPSIRSEQMNDMFSADWQRPGLAGVGRATDATDWREVYFPIPRRQRLLALLCTSAVPASWCAPPSNSP